MAAIRRTLPLLILIFQLPSQVWSLHLPRLEWQFQAESNLYAPPLVADLHPSSGLEIVISDAEARKLICLSSSGEKIWEYGGEWKRRLTSGASVSFKTLYEGPVLLIGNPDGNLHCIEAWSGKKLSSTRVGDISWTNAIWTDVDGDGRDEAVAATRREGIVCLRSDGNTLWRFPEGDEVKTSKDIFGHCGG